MTWDADLVVVVGPGVAAVADRGAWVVPGRPGQAATASAPVAATKYLTRWDSRVIR